MNRWSTDSDVPPSPANSETETATTDIFSVDVTKFITENTKSQISYSQMDSYHSFSSKNINAMAAMKKTSILKRPSDTKGLSSKFFPKQ